RGRSQRHLSRRFLDSPGSPGRNARGRDAHAGLARRRVVGDALARISLDPRSADPLPSVSGRLRRHPDPVATPCRGRAGGHENRCDDSAVAATGNARTYARALLGLEEIRRGEPRLAVAANGGALWNRVHRLVAAPGAPADRTSGWTAAVLALVTIGTLGAAARISDFAKA